MRREPWPPPGAAEARFLVEIDEVLAGWVPVRVLVVRVGEPGPALPWFADGAWLHLVLLELPNGEYLVRAARPVPAVRGIAHDPLPPPLANTPAGPPERGVRAMDGTPSFEEQVVDLVNQERWANGSLPPLKQVDLLHGSSGLHSANMAQRDFFAHCDPDTLTSAGDRMDAAGYSWSTWGENIAAGYSTPAAVMTAWMGSSGHRANILSTGYREIGVGYELQSGDLATVRLDSNGDCIPDPPPYDDGPFYHYWTQNFGRRTAVYPVVIEREAYETTSTAVDLYVYGEGWAVDMRFSNDGSSWSSWEGYVADKAWTLSSGNGEKTVYAEIKNGSTVYRASDTIVLSATCTGPDSIDLLDATVTTTEVYEACIRISAGPAFVVDDPGDVTCHAPTVVLKNGFRVLAGARFAAGA